MTLFSKKSNDILVSVEPQFLEDQSRPEENDYLWAYHIRIENNSNVSVQLKSRIWRIIDAHGIMDEVVGEGVVGEQPILDPGEIFEYSSVVPLKTPSGIMSGQYKMITELGDPLSIDIPAFSLDCPFDISTLH